MTISMGAPRIISVLNDQSTTVPMALGIIGGICGPFLKGPINTPVFCSSQNQFLKWFTPDATLKVGYDISHDSALQYLEKSGKLWVVRAASDDTLYGGCVIKDSTSGDANISFTVGVADPESYSFGSNDVFIITGCNQGVWNDDISIKIQTDEAVTKIAGTFYIYVYKGSTLVETWLCSRDQNKKDGYGRNIYIEDILQGSNYISAVDNVLKANTVMPKAQTSSYVALYGGDDGSTVTDTDIANAYDTMSNVNEISVQLLLNGGNTSITVAQKIDEVCEKRKDEAHGILTTPYSSEVTNTYVQDLIDYKQSLMLNTYRCSLYSPHILDTSSFTAKDMYFSPDGYVGGNISNTISNFGFHYATAGYRRGLLRGKDLSTRFTPSDENSGGDTDLLYDNNINPIVVDPNRGIVIMGQKTLWSSPSDLQCQNVSFLINLQVRPGLREFLKDYLFELNDQDTRNIIISRIDLFLSALKGKRAFYDYYIKSDDDNNTAEDIQNKILNVWIYVKPELPAEYIRQETIITPYGIDFSKLTT